MQILSHLGHGNYITGYIRMLGECFWKCFNTYPGVCQFCQPALEQFAVGAPMSLRQRLIRLLCWRNQTTTQTHSEAQKSQQPLARVSSTLCQWMHLWWTKCLVFEQMVLKKDEGSLLYKKKRNSITEEEGEDLSFSFQAFTVRSWI